MIILSRTLESRRNMRAFDALNVVDEVGIVEKVLAAHDSARAGGLVCTVYVVLDSRPFVRTRVTGLTNAAARQLGSLKPGQRIRISGQLQMKGYIVAAGISPATDGVEIV